MQHGNTNGGGNGSRGLFLTGAVVCTLVLGLVVALVGFFSSPAPSGGPAPSSETLAVESAELDGIDARSAELRAVFTERFGSAVRVGTVTEGQALKLAGRLGSAFAEYMGGSSSSYNDLMESWGGRLRSERGWDADRLEAFWARTPDRRPLLEFDFASLELKEPAATAEGVLVVRNEPGMVTYFQDTAWEFPGTKHLGDPRAEIRVVDVPVVSRSGEEGTLRMWWQWDTQELQWMPRRVYMVAKRDREMPMLVF